MRAHANIGKRYQNYKHEWLCRSHESCYSQDRDRGLCHDQHIGDHSVFFSFFNLKGDFNYPINSYLSFSLYHYLFSYKILIRIRISDENLFIRLNEIKYIYKTKVDCHWRNANRFSWLNFRPFLIDDTETFMRNVSHVSFSQVLCQWVYQRVVG